jgi:signal peptidase I
MMIKGSIKYSILLVFLLIILVCKAVIFEFYMVSSDSMSDVILPGDFILINRLVYGTRTPNRAIIPLIDYEFPLPSVQIPALRNIRQGDVVVIKKDSFPECEHNLVKRVAATEGQTVSVLGGAVFVDGMLAGGSFLGEDVLFEDSILPETFEVPPGKLFVLGDNAYSSYDSREFGFVDSEEVIGKAVLIYASKDIMASDGRDFLRG